MGNKIVSPLPNYETASSYLNLDEISTLKEKFLKMRNGVDIKLSAFLKIPVNCSPYLRKYFLPRLFQLIDSKKDGVIDFEEYLSAIVLFRIGTLEDKIKVLFMMYEPMKGGYLARDNLKQLLIDAVVATQKEDTPLSLLEDWIHDQRELSNGMVDMALNQFAVQDGKMEMQEFYAFVKVDGSVQSLLQLIPNLIET